MKFERPIKRSVVAWADQTGYPNDVVSGSLEHEYKSMMSYHLKYISLRVAPLLGRRGLKAGDSAAFQLCQNCVRTASVGAVWDAF
jgi:hypothetical protein